MPETKRENAGIPWNSSVFIKLGNGKPWKTLEIIATIMGTCGRLPPYQVRTIIQ